MDVTATIKEGQLLLAGLLEIKKYKLIGSAAYLPDPADVDFAVLLSPEHNACDWAGKFAQENDWQHCGEYDTQLGSWCAIRKGFVNLMLTHDEDFFSGYLTAMEVCKFLDLKDKRQRIGVCKIVRDGFTAEALKDIL